MSVRKTPIFIRKKELTMKKKLLLLALLPISFSSLIGCKKKADINIGVIQWAAGDALDKATKGFKQAVKAGLGGKSIDFSVKNAYGSGSDASSIVNTFVSKNKDLIMANATPAVAVAANATDTIPVVGTSTTSYEAIFPSGLPSNVTGTSDYLDIKEQVDSIFEWVPSASRVGILYDSAEANSLVQANDVENIIGEEHPLVSVSRLAFTGNDASALSAMLAAKLSTIDVLYIPSDNTCVQMSSTIHDQCVLAKIPVIAAEEGLCKTCGLATISIDYYHLGQLTGEMAVKILKDKVRPSSLEIKYDDTRAKLYNSRYMTEINWTGTIPEGYTPVKVK